MEKKHNILIIDDDKTLRAALQDVLIKYGYNVDSARNGILAIEKMKNFKFDLAILDIYMPEMDGLEVLKIIKSQNLIPKVIMLTAADGLRIAQESLILGADEFMTKPFNLNLLIETINRIIKS